MIGTNFLFEAWIRGSGSLDQQRNFSGHPDLALPPINGRPLADDVHAGRMAMLNEQCRQSCCRRPIRQIGQYDKDVAIVNAHAMPPPIPGSIAPDASIGITSSLARRPRRRAVPTDNATARATPSSAVR